MYVNIMTCYKVSESTTRYFVSQPQLFLSTTRDRPTSNTCGICWN